MTYTSKLSLNIILHVTILFTILSWLFMLYISKITSVFINNELEHIIKSNFDKLLYISKGVPIIPSISGQGLISSITNSIVTNLTTSIQTEINIIINSNPTIQNLAATNANLVSQLKQTTNSTIQQGIQSNINMVNSQIDLNIKNIIINFNYDYYINVFKQQDNTRIFFNETLFNNIKIINMLLVIFVIFYIFISIKSEALNMSEVLEVFTENIITFIFVGGVEFWFFTNVASKYVPAPPSLIFISFFNSLKKYLGKYIK